MATGVQHLDQASADDAGTATGAEAVVWSRLPFWLLLALLFTLPFLAAAVPPLTDYPSHLARFHVMLELARSPDLQRFYTFDWMLVGNLGTDLLVYPLGQLIGAERAAWAVAALIPPLTVLGLYAAAQATHGEAQATSFLGLAFVYSPSFLWGFLNFSLSLALALLAFALWVRWQGRGRSTAFAVIGIVTWLCHASGWGVLGLLIGGYELQRMRAPFRTALRLLPLALPVLLMLGFPQPAGTAAPYTLAYKASIYAAVLRDRWLPFDIACAALLAGFVYWALRSGRASFSAALGVPALLVLAASLVIPRGFFGGDLADFRLVPVAAMLGVAALRWQGQARFAFIALAFVGLRLAVTTMGWYSEGQVLERNLAALDQVPQGARIMAIVPFGTEGEPPSHDYSHLAGYAVVRRDALTNSNFSVPGLHMLGVKTGGAFSSDPSQRIDLAGSNANLTLVLNGVGVHDFDYIWILGMPERVHIPAKFKLIYRDRETALFRLPASN